jgi:hypothetical protein
MPGSIRGLFRPEDARDPVPGDLSFHSQEEQEGSPDGLLSQAGGFPIVYADPEPAQCVDSDIHGTGHVGVDISFITSFPQTDQNGGGNQT